jgi:hypothetical protein
MSYDYKITDLKYRMNGLIPHDVCKYFIDFYEKHKHMAGPEISYKNQTKKYETDNFNCISLSLNKENKEFKKPLELALKYINIVKTNYVFYIRQNICPTFPEHLIQNSFNLKILKYEKGQLIKDHTDIDEKGSVGGIRGSITINLNEEYEGGDFRFFNGQVKEKFKTGDAIFFPAELIWVHGTEPVTEGVRYSINTFLL